MSDNRRLQRVEKQLRQIVASYFLRGFQGRLRGLVTISRVESNPKLRTAKVFVSILGSDDDKDFSMNVLKENLREIQNEVNRELSMKFVPRISLHLDTGLEKMLRVESLLREVSHELNNRSANKGTSEDEE